MSRIFDAELADRGLNLPVRNVLAAIDTSPIAAKVVEHAVSFAAPAPGRVQVLSAFELEHSLRRISEQQGIPFEELATAYESQYKARVRSIVERARDPNVELAIELVHDQPRPAILETTRKTTPDLVVLGTSGHDVWERLVLGSTATRVLAEAPCPVLVVPFQGDSG